MRRSPANSTNRSLAAFGKLQVGDTSASVHHQVQRTRETRSLGVCGSKSAHCITLEMIDTVH